MSWRAMGLKPWLWQRLSAIYMAVFLLFFVTNLVLNPPADFAAWRQRLSQPVLNIGMILFWGALLVHAWVGMRNIVMDYVRHDGLRFATLLSIWAALAAMGVWVVRVLLTVTG